MSQESSADKSAPASQKRIRDSRKRGQSPKSGHVNSAALFFAMSVFLYLGVTPLTQVLSSLWMSVIEGLPKSSGQRSTLIQLHLFHGGLWILLPAAVALMSTVLAGLLQVGGLRFSGDPVVPRLEKVNPVAGFKRLFQLRRLVELGKSLVTLLLVAVATLMILRHHIHDLAHLPTASTGEVLALGRSLILSLMVMALPLFVVLGIADFLFQRFVWLLDLRMTKDEVKRERKEQDGDPKLKSHRKQVALELLEPDDQSLVMYITVVITGDTGQVVALYFDASFAPLPMVLFKYQGEQGQALLEIVAARHVRCFHHDSLARQLFIRGRRRQYVPAECAAEVGRLLAA